MKLLTVMTLALSVAFSMGCSSSATNTPSPAATQILTHELKVIADPQPAAKFLFNPIPLERDKYVHGRMVTIDVLPQSGWEIGEWVGPVFGVSGRTAKIAMDSSQRVVVRMFQPSTLGTAPSPPTGPMAEPPRTFAQPLPPSIPSVGSGDTPIPPATLTSGSSSNPSLGPVVLCLANARTTYFEGKALNEQAEWERAIEKLGEAISLDQRCASAYSSRGFAYLHTGQSQQAIQDYDDAIRLAPENPNLSEDYYNRAFVYQSMGEYQQAVQDLTLAIGLSPVNGYLYDLRSAAYNRLGETQKAIIDAEKACLLERTYCQAIAGPAPTSNPRPLNSEANIASVYMPSGHMGGLEITANQSVAQSFTVQSDGTLRGAAIVGINHHRCTPAENLHVRLLATLNGFPSSQVFYEEVIPPESVPETRGTIEIDFGPNGWPVGKYEILALELSTTASPSGCTYGWDGDAPGNYTEGMAYIAHTNGSGWFENLRDMGFQVFFVESGK